MSETPAQTFERMMGRPWPGGKSGEIRTILKEFNVQGEPGSEQANEELQNILLNEDYPGQLDEVRRDALIGRAVEAADRIIMEGANGSVEEAMYLTSAVARRWAEKTVHMTSARMNHVELMNRVKEVAGNKAFPPA